MGTMREAKFSVGQVVRHRFYPFRGVVFDIDPEFDNTEEWWLSIPVEIRPHKEQPYYHLLAENAETEYIAYVSEQNLLPDETGQPLRHPQVNELFMEDENGGYRALFLQPHCRATISKSKNRPADRAERFSLSFFAVEDAAYFFAAGAAAGGGPPAPGGGGGRGFC